MPWPCAARAATRRRRDQCVDDGCALWNGRLVAFIPIAPRVLAHVGSPELAALAIVGICLLVPLSQSDPVKGLFSGALGLALATIGLIHFGRSPDSRSAQTVTVGRSGTAAGGARHFCGGRGARDDPEPASPRRRFDWTPAAALSMVFGSRCGRRALRVSLQHHRRPDRQPPGSRCVRHASGSPTRTRTHRSAVTLMVPKILPGSGAMRA